MAATSRLSTSPSVQADALDILEAVDTRRSMCDLAKDSLFFEGGLVRSYQKVIIQPYLCRNLSEFPPYFVGFIHQL